MRKSEHDTGASRGIGAQLSKAYRQIGYPSEKSSSSALPIFDGGNIGVRRRQLHTMLKRPDYEPLLASGAA